MPSKTNTFENEMLLHIFQNADIALIGDAAGLQNSAANGSLYVSLHTADPGGAGAQNTNEANYGSYARVAVARTSGGWTVTNNLAENTAAVTFPQCSSGSNTITHVGIGTDAAGAGKLLYKSPLGSTLGPFVAEESNERFTIKNHGLSTDERITFFAVTGAVLPTGITEGTVYFVGTVVDVDNITLSTTAANANPVSISADGDGIAFKVIPLAVSVGIIPEFAAGAIDITED